MIVAWDLDGVLRDLMTPWCAAMGIRQEEVTRFHYPSDHMGGTRYFLDSLAHHGIWRTAPEYGALALALRTLIRVGVDCRVVTVCPEREWTPGWLRAHGLADLDTCYVSDKLSVSWDVIVEDHHAEAVRFARAGRRVYLVDRPWTRTRRPVDGVEFLEGPDSMAGGRILHDLMP